MAYKTYTVKQSDAFEVRVGIDGYQTKFLVESGRKFIKCQCEMNRVLRDDWRVEDIASRICNHLGIYAVKQTPCRINIVTNKNTIINRLGVVSDNFELDGYSFVSYTRLLNMHGLNVRDQNFIKMNSIEKLNYIIKVMSETTKIDKSLITKYILNMTIVDLLVLNQDRHFKNFGVFFNNRTQNFEVARLFDFGMGLFENDNQFDDMDTLKECMRYSYIDPSGDDPFVLAKMLKNTRLGYNYIRQLNISGIKIDRKMFLNPVAYEYFVDMKKTLEV